MSRVINTDSTGKHRSQQMRLCAEILRRLSQKADVDDDVRDMTAALVFALREIDQGIETSAEVWERRDYYMKAEELRQRWSWAGLMAEKTAALILENRWADLPLLLVQLLPHFADITVVKMTSKPSDWAGRYDRLMAEKPR